MKIVFARATAMAAQTSIRKGQHWPANDPVVMAYPSLFTDDPRFGLTFSVPPAAETATAEPGEKRTVSKVDAAFLEADDLREKLTDAGVKVDNRWGLERLRQEAAKLDD